MNITSRFCDTRTHNSDSHRVALYPSLSPPLSSGGVPAVVLLSRLLPLALTPHYHSSIVRMTHRPSPSTITSLTTLERRAKRWGRYQQRQHPYRPSHLYAYRSCAPRRRSQPAGPNINNRRITTRTIITTITIIILLLRIPFVCLVLMRYWVVSLSLRI